MIIHIVESGQSLSGVAAEYGVNIVNLAADNGLEEDTPLVIGQALAVQIPETEHTVQRGETLSSIARAYGTTALQLLRNNFRLGGAERLTTGERIIIRYAGENKTKTFASNSYAYPYIKRSLLREHMPYLTYFTPFTYGISSSGGLVRLDDEDMIRIANEYGTEALLHMSTLTESGNFSSARANLIFESEWIQNNLIDEILEVVEEKGFGGVDVDFEFIDPEKRYDYVSFLQELRMRLEPLGLPLFSALAPKTSDEQRGVLYEGHDYSGIGAAVNYVLLMTYEWGYTFGPPMAVAPINNVRKVAEYALTRIPSEKLFLGIPTYGYDWTLPYVKGGPGARSISPVEAVDMARRYGADISYDETAQSPWFRYTDNDGRLHEVWFEDARSITAKLSLAAELDMYGVGYWNSMREFPQNWIALNAGYNIQNLELQSS